MSVYVANAWSLFTLLASFISFWKCGLLRSFSLTRLSVKSFLVRAISEAYAGKFTSSNREYSSMVARYSDGDVHLNIVQ